jgi:hypothetical protein
MDSDRYKNAKMHLFVEVDSDIDRLSPDHLRLWACILSMEHSSETHGLMPIHYGMAVGYGGGGVQESLGFIVNEWRLRGMVSNELFPDSFAHWFDEEENGEFDENDEELCPPGYDPEDWRESLPVECSNWQADALIRAKLSEWLEEDESGSHVVVKADAITRMSSTSGTILRYAEDESTLLEVIDSVASFWGWPMHLTYRNGEFEHLSDGLSD